jgi:trehalose utilization protein
MSIRITVWNEFLHEQEKEEIRAVYPDGIHTAIATGLERNSDFVVRTATLDEPNNGIPNEVLDATDVLIWWGHKAHPAVLEDRVDEVHRRVLDGMGLVVLHSGHHSKIFKRLMGTTCNLKWREANDKERIWVVSPGHPIADGLDEYIELEAEEMYGEHFDIPQPDELIMVSWFTGGEVFRSGCCFYRGRGRIFYFRPGHESYPTYYNDQVLKVISNGVRWCRPGTGPKPVYGLEGPNEPLEELPPRSGLGARITKHIPRIS